MVTSKEERTFSKLADAIENLTCAIRESHSNEAVLQRIGELERKIMATQAELVADLKTVVAQLKKLDGDTKVLQASVDDAKAKIVDLEAIIAAGGNGVSQELIDAVAELKTAVQVVDDNVPEVPTPPTP